MDGSDVEYAPDGFLVTEFALIQRIYEEVKSQNSNDPFTCAVAGEGVAQPSLNLLSGSAMLECLDVGAASTLGGLHNMSVGVDHELIVPDGVTSTLFGAAQTCDSKQVSDGIISAHDFAVIMWAQFQVAPYNTLPQDKSTVLTVQGREKTNGRCGAGISTNDYQMQLADPSTFCIAGTPEANDVEKARRLDELGGPVSFEPPDARKLDSRVSRWASVPGMGEWSRIELLEAELVNIFSLELFLVGVGSARAQDISVEAPPAANCSAASCAPAHTAGVVTIGFQRRLDLLDGREEEDCAFIQRAAADALRGGTLAILQTPISRACPFDLFVWVPESMRQELGTDGPCNGAVGVQAGSNALDGLGGATQFSLSCAADPSPPPMPSSPPPPPPSQAPVPFRRLPLRHLRRRPEPDGKLASMATCGLT